MASITTIVQAIRNAIYGKDVRENIAQGIEAINTEVESTTARQNTVESTFQEVINLGGNPSAEVTQARIDIINNVTYDNLQDRLNANASSLAEQTTQINNLNINKVDKVTGKGLSTNDYDNIEKEEVAKVILKADKTYVDIQIQSVANGAPDKVYATLTDLENAFPTGDSKNKLVSANSHIYNWNGTAWVDTNIVYLSSPTVNDSSIGTQAALSSKVVTDIIYGNKDKTYGYTGQDTTYASIGTTRINNQQVLENLEVNKISLFIGAVGVSKIFKILELTRNTDGTFNFKKVLYQGNVSVGYNEFIVNDTISKGSYLGIYGDGSITISYATGGNGLGVAGEVTGNNHAFATYTFNWNFAITAKTLGVDSINNKVSEIYDNKIVTYGNPLVGSGSSSLNYVNILGTPTLRSGKVKKVNLLTLGAGECAILEFKKLASGNFQFIKQLGEFSLVSGVNNITIEDYIDKDIYIGYYSTNAVLAFVDNGAGYKFSGYSIEQNIAVTVSSAKFAINLEIEYTGLHDINAAINTLNNDTLDGTIFDIGTTIMSDFTNDGGWIDNLSPSTSDSMLYFTSPTGMDKWIGRVEINLRDSANLPKIVMCQPVEGGIYVTFDLVNNKIQIHSSWDGVVANVPAVLTEGTNTVTLTQGRDYVLTVEKDTVKRVVATIYDKVTAQKFSVEDITTGDAHSHGDGRHLGLIHKAGSYYRNRFRMATPQKTKPRLMIYGDSYIVGYNLIRYGFDINARYATLISNALNGDVSISAKGGEDTWGLIEKINTDFQIFKPKYTLLAIGLNDDLLSTSTFDQYKNNMGKLVNAVRNSGSIPILVTVPRINGAGIAAQFNSWVRNYSGCKYVDFQAATSLDGTSGSPPDNANFFLADGHPNVAGNQRYFDKFKLDCPYVFYEQ